MRYGDPEYEKLYASRSTPEKRAAAEKWRIDLFKHIAKQHPHLANRELLWEEWRKSQNEYAKARGPR